MPALRYWAAAAPFADVAPPLSGGVLDAWPQWLVQALAVIRAEVADVQAFLKAEVSNRE